MLPERGELLIASHNNPDPDSIVSALLLEKLIASISDVSVTVAYSGVIGRAENEALLEYSDMKLRPLRRLDLDRFQSVALVDTQPGTGNNPFDDSTLVDYVFDHHRLNPETKAVAFHDVRDYLGTTTTLLSLYWRAAGLGLTRRYATLMFYALRSETSDLGREATDVDRRVYKETFNISDLRAISRIVNAKVDLSYFGAVHEAIEQARVYGPLIVTNLGTVPYPDAVAQIAEYFLKYRTAKWSFSMGIYEDEILLSMRSDDPRAHLGGVAGRVVGGFGTAGGHGASAGGQISVTGKHPSRVEAIQKTVVDRLLKELDLESAICRNLLGYPPDKK
ncbi:MAG: DHH family phosphoesterase [Candidatus Latescibacterota bacterium]|nr:MAG: DHH family phosphoesterase [Candidatus Latescibacterota bacterium]